MYEHLSYETLVWLHWGTNFLTENFLWFIVLPGIVNALLLFSPLFRSVKWAKAATGSLDIGNLKIDDTYKFTHAFARNPRIFQSANADRLDTVFRSIDDKLTGVTSLAADSSGEGSGVAAAPPRQNKPLRIFFHVFNVSVLTTILVLNVYYYMHYANLIDKYFIYDVRDGYVLNSEFHAIEDEEKKLAVRELSNHIDLIFAIKKRTSMNSQDE